MSRMCCKNCFVDKILQDDVARFFATTGNCAFCGSRAVPLTDPAKLRSRFELIVDSYVITADHGKTLAARFCEDWLIFSISDRKQVKKMLLAVLGEEAVRKKRYVLSPNAIKMKDQWEKLRTELKHNNRYFCAYFELLRPVLEELISHLSIPPEKTLYRARINDTGKYFTCNQLKNPPAEAATSGRINPFGISYLYLASDPKTAIAEVRPHKGDEVCVATFSVGDSLKIVDLCEAREKLSPFSVGDTEFQDFLPNILLLSHLEKELANPILPRVAHLEYLPTQYLCEFIKSCGYDGVKYKSSLTKGSNYTLFNTGKAAIKPTITRYKITSTVVEEQKIRPGKKSSR